MLKLFAQLSFRIVLLAVFIAYPFNFAFAGDDDWIEQTGDVLQIALPVGAGATTLILQDWEGTWQFAKAFGASWLTTYTLKAAYGKMRPNGTARNSFPSGHTMGAFAGAAFIDNRYGHTFGIPAYTLAAFTGFSRVHSDWHFLDDVVAGASISMLWSWFIVTPKNPQKPSARPEPGDGPRISYILEIGSAFLSKNEVRAPSSGGTTFELNDFEKRDDPTTTASANLEAVLNERHDIVLLLNPFESRDNGQFSEPVTFKNVTFPANNNIETAWRMTDLRARWRYNFTPESKWDLRLGAGLAAEFVTVELASRVNSDTLSADVDDIALLPYAHVQAGYQLASRLKILAEVDGMSALNKNRFVDATFSLVWQFNNHWFAGIGYVYYNRDIETDDLTNHLVYNGVGFGVGHTF